MTDYFRDPRLVESEWLCYQAEQLLFTAGRLRIDLARDVPVVNRRTRSAFILDAVAIFRKANKPGEALAVIKEFTSNPDDIDTVRLEQLLEIKAELERNE